MGLPVEQVLSVQTSYDMINATALLQSRDLTPSDGAVHNVTCHASRTAWVTALHPSLPTSTLERMISVLLVAAMVRAGTRI